MLLCQQGQVHASVESYNSGWQLNIDNNLFKYRFYSSLLQSQFRGSVNTLVSDDIEHLLGSVSTGITREFGDNLRVSLFVRGVSPEVKGKSARNLWWASLAINRAW